MATDTSENALETLIVRYMTGTDGLAVAADAVAETPTDYRGTGYINGNPQHYDRAHALDVPQLFAFLRATQPEAFRPTVTTELAAHWIWGSSSMGCRSSPSSSKTASPNSQ